MNNKFYVFWGVIILVVGIISYLFFGGLFNDGVEIISNNDVEEEIISDEKLINNVIKSGDILSGEKLDTKNKIFVYVLGAVSKPGVIEITENARVYEAIDLAGGTLNNADVSRINLAATIVDEQKIIVPYKDTKKSESEKINELFEQDKYLNNDYTNETKNTTININTASSAELEKLDGIGMSIANKIVKYRNENGKYKTIEDIKNVSGIGENKYNAIKDNITVRVLTILTMEGLI